LKEDIWREGVVERKAALLRAHQKNIDRYESLLKTKLSELESDYLEKRLSEERCAIEVLHFISPSAPLTGNPGAI